MPASLSRSLGDGRQLDVHDDGNVLDRTELLIATGFELQQKGMLKSRMRVFRCSIDNDGVGHNGVVSEVGRDVLAPEGVAKDTLAPAAGRGDGQRRAGVGIGENGIVVVIVNESTVLGALVKPRHEVTDHIDMTTQCVGLVVTLLSENGRRGNNLQGPGRPERIRPVTVDKGQDIGVNQDESITVRLVERREVGLGKGSDIFFGGGGSFFSSVTPPVKMMVESTTARGVDKTVGLLRSDDAASVKPKMAKMRRKASFMVDGDFVDCEEMATSWVDRIVGIVGQVASFS